MKRIWDFVIRKKTLKRKNRGHATDKMSEIERIKEVYERRKIEEKNKLYSYFNEANLFIIHQREKAPLETFKKFNFSNLLDKRILDVGCGGGMLREFIKYRAKPENL